MNTLRKLISPDLKRRIKIYLHQIYRLTHNLPLLKTNLHVEEVGDNKSDIFFGYYDISPYNISDDTLIYHRRLDDNTVDICRYDLHKRQEEKVANSRAWNWQQGSRLRWIDENIVSFNDYIDGKYVNRMINIWSKEELIIDKPLYDISPNKEIGLSLNFERLGYLRPGYGYRCKNTPATHFNNQGIDIISIKDNSVRVSIDLPRIHKLMKSKVSLDNCYINHLSFSPDSKSFLFFFIEIIDGYHKASLVVYDMEKACFTVLEDEMKVSHYVWSDNKNILCSAYSSPGDCKYYIYNISESSKEIVLPSLLPVDGHPSYLTKDTILTDTYPDANGYQKLYTVNLKSSQEKELLKIYSIPVLTGERRTDLHPRINHSRSKVCIDACVKKNRKIYEITLDQ